MKILSLKAENIKRLSAIHIEPDGSLVIIGGMNRAGKTSVLDCISMALEGKGAVPPEPIRRGAKTASSAVDLGELVVVRSFTKNGDRLVVTTRDGEKLKSPQAILDSLVGKLSFDPLAFSRMEQNKQAEILRELVGIDFDAIDAKKGAAYTERTLVNRDAKKLKAQVAGMERFPDAPKGPVDVAQVSEEYKAAQAANEGYRLVEARFSQAESDCEDWAQGVARAEAALVVARNELERAKLEAVNARKTLEDIEQIDESELLAKITNAADTNAQVEANAKRKTTIREARKASEESDRLTAEIEACEEEKAKALADAAMPVDGLGLDEDGVTFNDLPFEQCSGAEQLQISVAIGLALNPKLPVILIRDGSLLDENSLKMLADMAEKAGAQIWLERVGEGDETAVIIEDGTVKEEE